MSYLNSSCESWKAVEQYLQNSKGKMIFSLEFCSQMYYQLSVKVELSIFPDMQDSKFYLFCTFSPEARGMCPVPKRERERGKTECERHGIQQKGRMEEKSQGMSHRWRQVPEPRRQPVQTEARKRRFWGKTELKYSLMCLAIWGIIWNL